jgi:hypothetical protein
MRAFGMRLEVKDGAQHQAEKSRPQPHIMLSTKRLEVPRLHEYGK